jgi:hypothetical protein
VKDHPLVYRRLPNHQAFMGYVINIYGPAAQMTFIGASEALLGREFPLLEGDRGRRSVVQAMA